MDLANWSSSWVICIMECPSPHACSQLTLTPPDSLTARLMHVSKHLRRYVTSTAHGHHEQSSLQRTCFRGRCRVLDGTR
jgi:hypothetical protein